MRTGYRMARVLVHDWNWFETNETLQNMGVGGFAKAIKDRATDYDWLSYNKENVQAYIDDPWCGHDNTGGFWKEFMGGLSKVWSSKELKKISQSEKVLIIAGQDDPVGRMGKGPKWLCKKYNALGLSRVDLKIYPGMRHEILNETDKETVYRDILTFIQACTD
jgi:alpha-beta hydrolase superfamily lysophospholipase